MHLGTRLLPKLNRKDACIQDVMSKKEIQVNQYNRPIVQHSLAERRASVIAMCQHVPTLLTGFVRSPFSSPIAG